MEASLPGYARYFQSPDPANPNMPKKVAEYLEQESPSRSPDARAVFAAVSPTRVSGFPGSFGARQYGQLRAFGRRVACVEQTHRLRHPQSQSPRQRVWKAR